MNLTDSQRRAIEHGGRNLQLIACAGSGKTEVVARRVVHLLTPGRPDSLVPKNIIAFTFTDKAAAELKERIVTRTREALGEIPGMAEMFVGTIHAFCLELLKSEVPKYLKFEVLNEVQQGLFVDRNSEKSGLTTSTDLRGAPLRRYLDTAHYLAALSILRESDREEPALRNCSIVAALDDYRALLDEHHYLDYSSILEAAVEVLATDDDVRSRLTERIRYVIVDEYQDVNPIQEGIVWSLHDLGARLCVVGDDDQTIYQWRGSDVENILTFSKHYPDVDQIAIEENFRSSVGIVETAREFIEKNTGRLTKAMKPTSAQPFDPGDIVALSFKTPTEEAQHLVQTMRALRGVAFAEGGSERGLSWSDMAVLLRSVKANGEAIIEALKAADIPFVVTGMANLFDTAEAEAARQLFYFIGSEAIDEAALEEKWTKARLGLDPAALQRAVRGAMAAKAAIADTDQQRWGEYSIQRVFLAFLEEAELREDRVPGGRGEVVFYNLGKFSQLISDFEAIHFHSKPAEKYASFAGFLRNRAENAYPEGGQDNQYANPDAVRIMTIHQAKGMQWPVVFVPALLRNRFPAAGIGGRKVWHLLPREGIQGQARFEGTIEDERRLFYVAMTRSQKFLQMTWAPIAGKNNRYAKASEFWDDVLASRYVKRRAPDYSGRKHLEQQPRAGVANVVFTFSDLKYFFECPYQFKLRVLYGFNAPIHEALGYGKSLHDALAEVHARAIRGDVADPAEVPDLVGTHLHVPYAYPALRQALEASAERVLRDYLKDNAELFDKIEFSEKQVEINLGDGVSISGRIDLVRRVDTDEITIVDLKSNDRAQAEDVTEMQLHTYALGYQELTGRRPDLVEIYELDECRRKPRAVDDDFMADVQARTREAATALRGGCLAPQAEPVKCRKCDYLGMCTAGRAAMPNG
ncbi:MAG TPA: ATP-dependent DNA helicase [Thermoanaerobaculia bacterium]|nr:ATP-dependent DNA helicase [Thermoanaerobaculia bacterium]